MSQNEEESNYNSNYQNERLIQLVPKKFKENLVYKYRDKHTEKRMKSVRALKPFDIHEEVHSDNDADTRQLDGASLLSPNHYKRSNPKKSTLSGYGTKMGSIDRSTKGRDVHSGMQYFKDDTQSETTESQKEAFIFKTDRTDQKEFIDLVNLQNELFQKMYVESPDYASPTNPKQKAKRESPKLYKKSTYPRSKIPVELKEKFDMISENFNYNDEFWKPENIKKSQHNDQNGNNDNRLMTTNMPTNRGIKSPRGTQDPRCLTAAVGQTVPKDNAEKPMVYIKADWIDKIIKIKEGLDKKCKC